MTLTLVNSVYRKILAASREAAPLESCGLLAGTGERATMGYTLTNADASPEHYRMLPEEQFAAVKDMRRNGLRTLAVWHSHPASPARMSEEDMRLAFTPDVAYVILSLAEPDRPQIRAFGVSDGTALDIPIIIEKEESQPS